MKRFLPILLLIVPIVDASVLISEIMPNPIADESLNEWIEIYNNGSSEVNVSGWRIGDNTENDTLAGGSYNGEGTIIPAFGYAIITDDSTRVYNNFNVSQSAIRLYVDDSSIGNSLNNGGETIYLYNISGGFMDSVSYSSSGEGFSWAIGNGTVFLSAPSPGFPNDATFLVSDENECDYSVAFLLSKDIFENSSEFEFRLRASNIKGPKTNITGRASIKDLFGAIIKEYSLWANESITSQKTSSKYTPNLAEGKSYEIKSNITTQCNDANSANNFDSRIITIKGSPPPEDSSLSIESILDLGSDKKARFGQTIRVRARIYKGDTTKEAVSLWVEDSSKNRISKQSSVNVGEKFTSNIYTMPVQINPNCDLGYRDGDYNIKISGLGEEDEKDIEIEGTDSSLCKEIKVESGSTISSKDFSYELIDFPHEIISGEKFEVSIRLDNSNDADIPIKAWSYVYRGSKSYSGERDGNMKQIVVRKRTSDILTLNNLVPEAEPGSYKLKVMINKNSQKTSSELTEDVAVAVSEKSQTVQALGSLVQPDSEISAEQQPIQRIAARNGIIYESSTQKAGKIAVAIFVFLLASLAIILLIKKA